MYVVTGFNRQVVSRQVDDIPDADLLRCLSNVDACPCSAPPSAIDPHLVPLSTAALDHTCPFLGLLAGSVRRVRHGVRSRGASIRYRRKIIYRPVYCVDWS